MSGWLRRKVQGWRKRFDERQSSLTELLASTRVTSTPIRWERTPTLAPSDEVCLFLTFAAGGRIPDHSLAHAQAWATAGFKVVLIVTIDEIAGFVPPADYGSIAGTLVRKNEGYDFGGWAAAIRALPELRTARRLAIVNDSIYGPFATFPAFLARIRESKADFIGAIGSLEQRPHYQSFLLVFAERALRSDAFWRFWRSVRNGSRYFVIDRYETKLLQCMIDGGLSTEALFPATLGDHTNLTLTDAWRTLVAAGFPFVKIRLLRDNPCGADISGWREVLSEAGFNLTLIHTHLGAKTPD